MGAPAGTRQCSMFEPAQHSQTNANLRPASPVLDTGQTVRSHLARHRAWTIHIQSQPAPASYLGGEPTYGSRFNVCPAHQTLGRDLSARTAPPNEVRDAQVRGLTMQARPQGTEPKSCTGMYWTHGKWPATGTATAIPHDQVCAQAIAEYLQPASPPDQPEQDHRARPTRLHRSAISGIGNSGIKA